MDTRSARRRTRCKKMDFGKQMIRLDKLRDTLYRKRRSLGWEPVNPPVMRGWKRSFVLREDVARSPQSALYERILQRINTVQYSKTRDFTNKRRRKRKKEPPEREHHLLKAKRYEFQKWQLTRAEADLFVYKQRWSAKDRRWIGHFEFSEPWRYVLRIEKNMITQVRIRDEALEAEIDRLKQHIQMRNLQPAIDKARSKANRWRAFHTSDKDKAILKNMEASWQNYLSGERI